VVADDLVVMKMVQPGGHVKKPVNNDVLLNAASNLILASYRNQLTHVFVRVALVALAINGCRQETMTIGENRLLRFMKCLSVLGTWGECVKNCNNPL